MGIAAFFDKLSDRLEYAASTPYAFIGFIVWVDFVPLVSIDVANYGISVITALLLFITIGPQRRSNKALHAKLDDLETQIECADSNKAGIETLPEAEIDKIREA